MKNKDRILKIEMDNVENLGFEIVNESNFLNMKNDKNIETIPVNFAVMSRGKQYTFLSKECTVALNIDGVEFNKNNNSITLTKEELINEFKIGLEKGYYTIEELSIK